MEEIHSATKGRSIRKRKHKNIVAPPEGESVGQLVKNTRAIGDPARKTHSASSSTPNTTCFALTYDNFHNDDPTQPRKRIKIVWDTFSPRPSHEDAWAAMRAGDLSAMQQLQPSSTTTTPEWFIDPTSLVFTPEDDITFTPLPTTTTPPHPQHPQQQPSPFDFREHPIKKRRTRQHYDTLVFNTFDVFE